MEEQSRRTVARWPVPPKNTGVSQTRICQGRKVASSRITRPSRSFTAVSHSLRIEAAPGTCTAGQKGIVYARVRVLVAAIPNASYCHRNALLMTQGQCRSRMREPYSSTRNFAAGPHQSLCRIDIGV